MKIYSNKETVTIKLNKKEFIRLGVICRKVSGSGRKNVIFRKIYNDVYNCKTPSQTLSQINNEYSGEIRSR